MDRGKPELLKPGDYEIEVTLRMRTKVGLDDETTEDELLSDCRRRGEMVDWDTRKV